MSTAGQRKGVFEPALWSSYSSPWPEQCSSRCPQPGWTVGPPRSRWVPTENKERGACTQHASVFWVIVNAHSIRRPSFAVLWAYNEGANLLGQGVALHGLKALRMFRLLFIVLWLVVRCCKACVCANRVL